MFRKFAVAILFAAIVSVLSFGVAMADEIWVGDSTIVTYYGTVAYGVGPDSDPNTGQVIFIHGSPTVVDNQSKYWHQWAPGNEDYFVAWTNHLLDKGCEFEIGCGSVRVFHVRPEGVTTEVINDPIIVEPKLWIMVTPGKAKNSKTFMVMYSGATLWGHCLSFGDGEDSKVCFDGPSSSFLVSHDYDHKGGEFTATLTIQTRNGPMTISSAVVVK